MLISICNSRVTIKRQSAYILTDTAVASSISVSTSPIRKTTLQLDFSVSQTGEATITGSLSSTSVSETISLSSNKFKQCIKQYDTITTLALDSAIVAAGGTVAIKSIGRDGSPQTVLTTIKTSYPAAFKRQSGSGFNVERYGSIEDNKPYFAIPYDPSFIIRDTDIIYNEGTGETFFVVGNPIIEHRGYQKHWHVRIERKEQ